MTGTRSLFLFSSFLFNFLLSCLLPLRLSALDNPFDHSAWDRFLKQYVNEEGALNFEAAHRDRSNLDAYLKQISEISWEDFSDTWPREEKLALWLNAYHAGLVKTVLDHFPVKSVHGIPGVWDLPVVAMADRTFGLNEIRERELIQFFRDEKIHVALACGAESCPRFRREAYTGPRVEGQLYLATRDFVNDSVLNEVGPGGKEIRISHLFKWYAKDFTLDFGSPESHKKFTPEEAAVLSFIVHYLDSPQKIEFLESGKYKIKYLPFEWTLREWQPASSGPGN